MIVRFDKSFTKALDKIKDKIVLKRIESVIEKAENANALEQISNTKKLIGYSVYYRIKIGDYRNRIRTD